MPAQWTLVAYSLHQRGYLYGVERRADKLFAARPEPPEQGIGVGKNAKIGSTGQGDYVVFHQDGRVRSIDPGHSQSESP
ncbi:MAG TPA: hypothetical protein VK404_08195 [Spirosoma sp.]|nr:hypothetical protein [Spirosoma sp.]